MTDVTKFQNSEPKGSIAKESWSALYQMAEKYQYLVWYQRHRSRKADPQRWMKIPIEIRQSALQAALEVERAFPAETEALTKLNTPDWTHGFNSGVLAGVRFAMTCVEGVIAPSRPDEASDFNGQISMRGPAKALAEFPDLDS